MIRNGDFGTYIAPLMRPVYTMQMARSKRWSAKARLETIGRLRAACVEVIESIDRMMPTLCDEATFEGVRETEGYCCISLEKTGVCTCPTREQHIGF